MRRLLLAVLAMAPLLGGCWDQYSIERLGFVTIVAVDGTPGKIHAILNTVVPGNLPNSISTGTKGSASDQYVGDGPTLYEAIRAANKEAPKRLFFGQIQDVIIGEQLAAAGGLQDVLDFFGRENKSRNIAWVYMAKSKDLQSLVKLNPVGVSYPAEALNNLSIIERLQGDAIPRRIFDVGNGITRTDTALSIPRITPRDQNFALDGTDLFHGKWLIGHVGDVPSRGIALLSGLVAAPLVNASCRDGGKVSVVLRSVHPKLGAEVVQGKLRSLWVLVKASGDITQVIHCPGSLKDPSVSGPIYASAADDLTQIVATTVRELQAYKSDGVGFGEQIREHYPGVWSQVGADWSRRTFPHLNVAIHVEVTVSNSGLLDGQANA